MQEITGGYRRLQEIAGDYRRCSLTRLLCRWTDESCAYLPWQLTNPMNPSLGSSRVNATKIYREMFADEIAEMTKVSTARLESLAARLHSRGAPAAGMPTGMFKPSPR